MGMQIVGAILTIGSVIYFFASINSFDGPNILCLLTLFFGIVLWAGPSITEQNEQERLQQIETQKYAAQCESLGGVYGEDTCFVNGKAVEL